MTLLKNEFYIVLINKRKNLRQIINVKKIPSKTAYFMNVDAHFLNKESYRVFHKQCKTFLTLNKTSKIYKLLLLRT